jgi:hypothetical protein
MYNNYYPSHYDCLIARIMRRESALMRAEFMRRRRGWPLMWITGVAANQIACELIPYMQQACAHRPNDN